MVAGASGGIFLGEALARLSAEILWGREISVLSLIFFYASFFCGICNYAILVATIFVPASFQATFLFAAVFSARLAGNIVGVVIVVIFGAKVMGAKVMGGKVMGAKVRGGNNILAKAGWRDGRDGFAGW